MFRTINYLLLLFYHIINFINNLLMGPIENQKPKLQLYIEENEKKLLKTYNNDFTRNMNENINKSIYDKEEFKKILDTGELEKDWKRRILFECVEREDGKQVSVIMYYDIYKQGFAYFSSENSVSYKILNAIAMKYVLKFFCRDFYMDEYLFIENNMELLSSKLKDVFLKYDEKQKEKNENEEETNEKKGKNVMAKLKKYNFEKTEEKEYLQNKFINMGKIYNFSFLQKQQEQDSDLKTSFDDSFHNISWKDYKSN